jgi:hypothetical protein
MSHITPHAGRTRAEETLPEAANWRPADRSNRRARSHRSSQTRRLRRRALPPARLEGPLTLRLASDRDTAALARRAELDSSFPPADPVLLAEVAGELRAALSLNDGVRIAEPFHPTAEIVRLLVAWATRDQIARPQRMLRACGWRPVPPTL